MNELKKTKIEFIGICVLLILIFGILIVMYLRVGRTSDESATEILREKNQFVIKELDLFFQPIQERLEEEHSNIFLYGKSRIDSALQTRRAFSMVRSSEAISSMVIADTTGTQEFFGKLYKSNRWYYIKTHKGNKTDKFPDVKRWRLENDEFVLDSEYVKKSDYDPRERPWFRNAMKNTHQVWTEPYMFATSHVPGITLSKLVKNKDAVRILQFDIRLESLCIKTSNIKVSDNGFAFIVTDSSKIIGLPQKAYANSSDSIKKYVLKDVHELNDTVLSSVYNEWKKISVPNFKVKVKDKLYWVQFSSYVLGNVTFYVGIVAPEEELIGSILKTQKILFYGLVLILVFSLFIGYSYRQKLKINTELNEKNRVIESQKKQVEEKQKEILDSIQYAKRIQQSLMPSEKYIERNVNKLKNKDKF
jgi:hypothetical protein